MPLTRKRFLGLAGRGALGAAAYSTFGFLDRAEGGVTPDGTPCDKKPPHLPFRYRGEAVGVRGEIRDPPHGPIPPQAVIRLDPENGGHDKKVVSDGFDFKGILFVNSAYSLVTGNPDLKACEPVFRTVVTSVVNGVEIDGVIRATSIVASLESQQPEKRVTEDPKFCEKHEKDCELEMTPVGYFDNLTIRGYAVNLGPADYLTSIKLAKKSDLDQAILREVTQTDQRISQAMKPGDNSCTLGHDHPAGLGVLESYECSIFSDESIKRAVHGIPGVTACKSGRIHIADLGDVFLGRYGVQKDDNGELRRLTMVRVLFNSPPTGEAELASVVGDGRPR